jgi:adenylosuccinate lyase
MEFQALDALSPLDGRYRKSTESLSHFFSESAIIRYRVFVEVEYFLALCNLPLPQLETVTEDQKSTIQEFAYNFSSEESQKVKDIEKVTNHDVKAVEIYLRNKFEENGLGSYTEFIHFGLTSQDINNTAFPMAMMESMQKVVFPNLQVIIVKLTTLADSWKSIPMLAHTHGQPASPTHLGKEILVFAERLQEQFRYFNMIPFTAKFGGATGNFNAHHVAYPEIDWIEFADTFTSVRLGLIRQKTTTQIEHYDHMAACFDNLKRINNILIDLCRDIWTYISMEYFKQKVVANEVGSSAMPHKVNPIDFENAEGNLGLANAILEHLAAKLPISRLQRDLTDSTVIRNIGVPFGHSIVAYKSIMKGLDKLKLNESAIKQDLDNNWAVVAEGIQTILRRESYPDPYNALKMLTRTGEAITHETITLFIDDLDVTDKIKETLRNITPENYTGIY